MNEPSNRHPYELVLVGCTSRKRDEPAPARDLYDESPLFRRRRRIAIEYATEWGILSAEHEFVDPDDELAPYDTHISDVPTEPWADGVWSELEEIVDAGDRVCILAGGRDYVDPIRYRLHDAGAHVACPLRSQMPGIQFNICDDLYDALSANAGTQQLCTDGGRQVALDGANLADSEIDGPVRSDPPTKDSVKEAFGVVGTPRSVLIEEYDTLGEIEDASRVELVNLDGVGHATVDKIEDAGELYEEGDDGYLLTDGGVDRSEYEMKRRCAVFTVNLAVMYTCAVVGMCINDLIQGTVPDVVGWAIVFVHFWEPILLAAVAATVLHDIEWLQTTEGGHGV